MAEHSRFYRSPLLLAAAFFAIGVAAVGSLTSANSLTANAVAIALFVSYGLVIAFFRSGHDPRRVHLYLATLTTIAIILVVLLPQTDYALILFSVLCVYAALLLEPRSAALWIGLFIVITGFGLIKLLGQTGIVTLVGQTSGYFAFAVVGGALRQAEIARRQTQVLLAELNEAHRKLQDYAVQSQKLAIAEERNRLARDLHDSVKQQAFAVAAQLGAARSLLHRDPQTAETRLVQAEQLSDTLRQELANMILELRPPALEEKGLAAALRDYAVEWSRQGNIPVEVVASDSSLARPEIEQAFFRITQEALNNIARHSRASRATIEYFSEGDAMSLRINDDGQGFDRQVVRDGLGLHSMRERVDSLNGMISIESAPGHGTKIDVRIKGSRNE